MKKCELKKHREKNNMTQDELSKACGYASNPVAQWESGARIPSIENAYKVAAVLDVRIYEIWRDDTRVLTELVEVKKVVIDDPDSYFLYSDNLKNFVHIPS
jgi:DNA-binding XRE family transcriptional regulator